MIRADRANRTLLTVSAALLGVLVSAAAAKAAQLPIAQVNAMPNKPAAALTIDWYRRAHDYDTLITNPNGGASFTDAAGNIGLPAYYEGANDQEAISIMPALMGRYLLNESNSAYIPTLAEYWQQPTSNGGNGAQVYLNNIGASQTPFWYGIMPNYYAIALTSVYGDANNDMLHKWYTSANAWSDCGYYLNHNFTPYLGYDFINHVGLTGNHTEPDAPGGIAWIEYMAYTRFGDSHFLTEAETDMNALDGYTQNYNYEGPVMCLGALTAARLNAEQGKNYDDGKILNWIFNNSNFNNDGIFTGSYNGYEVNGLSGGSAHNSQGKMRAFSMNSFVPIIGLLPLVRYDDRYATAIGKYLNNLAVNAQWFYEDMLPSQLQDLPGQVPQIPYESFDSAWTIGSTTYSPYDRGDAVEGRWAPTDRACYGGSLVGLIGGTMSRTNNPNVLQWDCLKLDFDRYTTYPTYLYYNPTGAAVTISLRTGPTPTTLYDLTTNTVIASQAKRTIPVMPTHGVVSFSLPAGTAYVVCEYPTDATVTHDGSETLVKGQPIDYR